MPNEEIIITSRCLRGLSNGRRKRLALLVVLVGPVQFDDANRMILPLLIMNQFIDIIGGKLLGRFLAGLPEWFEMLGRNQDGNRMRGYAEQKRRFV